MKNFKQMLKQTAFAALGVFAFSFSQHALAQTPAGTSETIWGGTQVGASSTGSYVADLGASGQNVAVTVWDGPTAGLGWNDVGSGSSGIQSLVVGNLGNDPDVAMTQDGKCTAVVYELGGDIYLENYHFDQGIPGMVYISGPTLVSSGAGTAENPNIDGGSNYMGVIVWTESSGPSNNVYTRGVDICGGNLFPIVDISGSFVSATTNSIQPDVSVYQDGGNEYFNYAYVDIDASGMMYDLIYQIEEASAIYSGSSSTYYYGIGTSMNYTGGGEKILSPRIASQLGTGTTVLDASTIVFTITSGGGPVSYHIWSYNNVSATSYLTSGPPNITGLACISQLPVVCWTNSGEYIAAWSYNGSCSGVTSVADDFLSVKLSSLGVPSTGYQWVNFTNAGTQRGLSIASRYSQGGQIYSGFHSNATNNMMYKYTNSASPVFFREASSVESDENLLNAYPNPVSDILSVEARGTTSVALYSITGQLLRSYGAADLAEKSVLQIQVSDFPAGVYLLKAEGDDYNYTEKIIIE